MSGFTFDTLPKRLLHSKSPHWTRVRFDVPAAGIVLGSSARAASTQPEDHASSPLHTVPQSSRTRVRGIEAMTLYDDKTIRNSDSTLETMTPEHESHNGGSAVLDAPETVQPSPAETQASAPDAVTHTALAHTPEAPTAAANDDFAAALENYTSETEESVGDDHVIKGTVVKLTGTHVVVDIGAKSEGMLPLAEVLDHEGQPRFKPGDEIDVMREKGETEDGYPKLSHLKAQRLRAWDDIEKAHNEKKPIKGIVVERIKGGLTVDINGARAFLPGSQVDLRPIRNLDGMKG